jgi:hypothetical protein
MSDIAVRAIPASQKWLIWRITTGVAASTLNIACPQSAGEVKKQEIFPLG